MEFETNLPKTDKPLPAEMQARMLAWVCGDASPDEAAELARLAAADPQLAAYKRRAEQANRLVMEAVARDKEPLRLSARRRRALLRTFMPRRNLVYAAGFSVAVIAAVAWYGERTHFVSIHIPRTPITFNDPPPPVDTDKDPVDEPDDSRPRPKPDVSAPVLPDNPPVTAPPDGFMQKIEPPAPISGPGNLTTIPQYRTDAAADGRLFDPSQLDQLPVARHQARPVYPAALRDRGISGDVLVDFIVDPNGDVKRVSVVRSTASGFEEAACNAVARWKFKPGRKGGRAVFVHLQVPIVFSLNEDPPR